MVGRGDAHRVDGIVFEHLSVINERGRALAGGLLALGCPLIEDLVVNITQRGHLDIFTGQLLKRANVIAPATTDSDHAHANSV